MYVGISHPASRIVANAMSESESKKVKKDEQKG